jgi:hypothetical protein
MRRHAAVNEKTHTSLSSNRGLPLVVLVFPVLAIAAAADACARSSSPSRSGAAPPSPPKTTTLSSSAISVAEWPHRAIGFSPPPV